MKEPDMHLSMWTYPWDVQDLGLDAVTADLKQRAGLNTVSLATSYHAGRFLQPRSPKRKTYFPEDGTVYFKPTPSRWEHRALKPQVASLVAENDVLGEFTRRRDATGLAVSCWTVCLHNMRLGLLHPGAVTRSAVGDASPFGLCPSHPDARAYVTTLVEDVTRTYKPDVIELETPGFMGFAHGFHHEKDGIGLTAEDDLVFSLCFCPACMERSAKAGVDAGAAKRTVAKWIIETCERETPQPRWPDFPAGGLDVFRPYPEVYDFLMWRFEPVTSLVAEIRDRADPATKVYVIDLDNGWLGGGDTAQLAKVSDGLILCAYDKSVAEVSDLVARGRGAAGKDRYLGAGFRLFYPEMRGADDILKRTRAAVSAGADGVNYYNYGLVPAPRLDWLRKAIAAVPT
jgi:hypothetical protein